MQDSARQATEIFTERTQDIVSATLDAVAIYKETSENIHEDVKAMQASSTSTAGAVSEIYSAWSEWFSTVARVNSDAAQKLMKAKSLQQVAELQQELATGALRSWMERNARVLEVTQRTSKEALRPLANRLSRAA